MVENIFIIRWPREHKIGSELTDYFEKHDELSSVGLYNDVLQKISFRKLLQESSGN